MRTYPGDHLGLDFPADAVSLDETGPEFLTAAFRRAGVLDDDAAVIALDSLTEFGGGSTGRKALLTVSYRGAHRLPRELFVKFSRDFDDPARDLGRTQMALEVRFALLTRAARFPIAVPRCLFADYHAESGTGILITDRIAFGSNGIEQQHAKCADYAMPEPLQHYEALLGALGRLAGSDKAGLLGAGSAFSVDIRRLSVGDRRLYSADQLHRRVDLLGELAARRPGLLPADIVAPQFISCLHHDVEIIARRVDALWDRLAADTDHVALCHWNANVDNAWFWRAGDQLQCGLLDWGCVGRMNLAMAIWGALCSAETSMWDKHFEHLLRHFADEYAAAGGPRLDTSAVHDHVLAYVAIMGTTWLLDVPGFLLNALPEPVTDRFDPAITESEQIRSRLLMMTNFLNLWAKSDASAVLDEG
ncbi:hypothetical protein [Mycobacterium sp. SMC-4]|uniref:hypothetical protein n=1 Tax=Mycobacterium sp. SMC-4 TaxID=2857059 RepID=UPI0021B16D45|nr:hypothetical protein [Mycobacterium sp. SMC-4]UXA18708.1 hypothetical protein KXD98_03105 [Mycobacterium sp. SMC-4]